MAWGSRYIKISFFKWRNVGHNVTLLFFVKRLLSLSVSMTFTTLHMEPAEPSRMPLSMVQAHAAAHGALGEQPTRLRIL